MLSTQTIKQNVILKFQKQLSSLQFYCKYIIDESNCMLEIIIDISSKLFRNAETKGLQLFKAIIQENNIIDIIMRLIQGYYLKDTQDKMIKLLMKILIISQQKNFALYSIYKNPNINIMLTFFSLFRDQISLKNTARGKAIKHNINITKLRFYIFQSSEEFPHYKLRSIREQYLSLSRFRQKKLESVFSNRIEQNTIINMYIKVRTDAYRLLLNRFLFKINIHIATSIVKEQINIVIINVRRSSVNPILVDSDLYQEIKQFNEKKEELKGLQNRNQNQKNVEIIFTFVNQFDMKQTQI
ncbi:hypothetical protein ABPG72_021199 [Tetrahymena utriculariae]